jgi:hypothetical protein
MKPTTQARNISPTSDFNVDNHAGIRYHKDMNSIAKNMGIERIQEIKCYRFFGADGSIERLDFIPVDNAPGFSHRVAYNGKLTRKYLGSGFTMCQRNALDMLDIVRNEGK